MRKLISIIVLIFCGFFTTFAQDSLVFTDTIYFKTGEVQAVHVLKINTSTFEYRIKQDTDVYYRTLSSIKKLKTSDGNVVLGTISRSSNITKVYGINNNDSLKRKGHVIINSNLFSLLRNKQMSFINVGVIYYPTSNFSLGFSYLNGRERKRDYFKTEFKDGFDVNFGFSTSKKDDWDIGFRGGLIFKKIKGYYDLSTLSRSYQETSINEPDDILHNGKYYKEDYSLSSYTTEYDYRFDISNYISFYGGLEISVNLSERLIMKSLIGLKMDKPKYWFYPGDYKNITNYYDTNNNLVDTVETSDIDQYRYDRLTLQFFCRLSINFRIFPIKKVVKRNV